MLGLQQTGFLIISENQYLIFYFFWGVCKTNYNLEIIHLCSTYKLANQSVTLFFSNQRTDAAVNIHLIWIARLVGELMTPALGHGLYGPLGHDWLHDRIVEYHITLQHT